MSVINQVLNRLDQRGVRTAAEQTMVRAVPPAKRNFALPLLAFGLVFVVGIALWLWTQREPALSQSKRPASPVPESNVATLNNAQQQPAVAATEPTSEMSAENSSAELSPPASRLSLELGAVPVAEDRGQTPAPVLPLAKTQERLHPEQDLRDKKNISAENTDLMEQPTTPTVKPRRKKAAKENRKVASLSPNRAVPIKQVSPAQQADAEFRKAVALMQQGRIANALAGFEAALRLDAGHDAARQALVALLLENKRGADAEQVLQARLNSKPEHTGFTMLLARLQLDRGALAMATKTLENSLPYANEQADYHAFLAALLQRQNRHEEAIEQYKIVTQLAANNGVWLMGYGISLQAAQRNADAKEVFQRALDTQTLSAELQAFVRGKIKEL